MNDLYAAAGTTWLNVNVNELLENNNFQNWERRQRGWLSNDGVWKSRMGGNPSAYFCVIPGRNIVFVLFN